MSRSQWAWVRLLGGAAILAALVWRLGAGPFLRGIRTIDGWSLAAAAGIAVVTTVCSAWRWTAAYYRSQFLNTILPGGILGDVHRGVVHGRDVGDVGRALRAVAWERSAGQAVQAALAVIVLLALPSPVRSAMPVVLGVAAALVLAGLLLLRVLPHRGPSRAARTLRAAGSDLRNGVLARGAWPGILAASIIVAAGLTTTFLIAARTAGVSAGPVRLLPLALLVLVATGVPTNIGGWGPREGVAAWAFGAAGLGAAQGIAAAVVFGVMVLVASLPGALVLVVAWFHRGNRQPDRIDAPRRRSAVASPEGAARG
jgi:hypothetical protein